MRGTLVWALIIPIALGCTPLCLVKRHLPCTPPGIRTPNPLIKSQRFFPLSLGVIPSKGALKGA